jgi:hypothetical protein
VVLDNDVPDNGTSVEPGRVPPFDVPPPPPLTSRPVPPVQPAPEPTVDVEPATIIPPRISKESPESPVEEELLPAGRPSGVPPPPPTAPRPISSQPKAETQEPHDAPRSRSPSPPRVIKTASHDNEEHDEDPPRISIELPQYTNVTTQPQRKVSQPDPPEQEVLADEDGGESVFDLYSNPELTPYS